MDCIFIYGPAASGKLTVAMAVQNRSRLPLFHNHLAVDAALSLFEFGSAEFVRLRELIWLATFKEAAAAGKSFLFTFTPEATVSPSFIDKAVSVIKSFGGRILFIALTCSNDVIESRIEAASRTAFKKLASLEQYRQLRESGAFMFASLPEPDLTIATDAMSPEDSAGHILDFIESQVR